MIMTRNFVSIKPPDDPERKEPETISVDWYYPRIGTCDDPIDSLRIEISRVRVIPDLIVMFDGTRNGWVLGASFRVNENDFEFKELRFIPENEMKDSNDDS